jgi:hypothetical protein
VHPRNPSASAHPGTEIPRGESPILSPPCCEVELFGSRRRGADPSLGVAGGAFRDRATMGCTTIEDIRTRTFQLTCLAASTDRPTVSSPLTVDGPPIGICASGPRHSDRAPAALRIADKTH